MFGRFYEVIIIKQNKGTYTVAQIHIVFFI